MRNVAAFVLSTALTALVGPSLAAALSTDHAPAKIEVTATPTADLNVKVIVTDAKDIDAS